MANPRPTRLRECRARLFLVLALLCLPVCASADAPPVVDFSWDAPGLKLAISPDGSLYVADYFNARVQHFSSTGTLLGSWVPAPAFPNYPSNPVAISVDGTGQVYVAVLLGSKIRVYDSSGNLLRSIAGTSTHMSSLDVGTDGSCYALGEDGISVFDATGQFIRTEARGRGSYGPQDIAVDEAGNAYMAVQNNGSVFKFGPTGAQLALWEHVILQEPGGIVASNGTVVVGSKLDSRLVELTTEGQLVWSITLPAQARPLDVVRDKDSGYYVLDDRNQKILHLAPAPVPARSSTWGQVKDQYRH